MIDMPATADQPAALVVGTYSTEPVQDLFDRVSYARLSVTCAQNRTSLRVQMPGNVLSGVGSYGAVSVSLDDAPPQLVTLSSGETDDTLGLMVGSQTVQLVIGMMQAKTMRVALTTMNDRSRSAEFALDGLGAAMQPLRRACNW